MTNNERLVSFTEITKKNLGYMLRYGDEVENYDYTTFGGISAKFLELESLCVKPHLIVLHENIWEAHLNYIWELLEFVGYERIGRMEKDLKEDGETYKFESNDTTYETLYRFKDGKKADYSTTLKMEF